MNGGPVANGKGGKTGGAGGKRKRGVSAKVVEEEGYGGDVEEDGADVVKKIKSEEVEVEMDGEKAVGAGEEKEMVEMAFMMEEEEGEEEGGEGEMIEA